MNTAAPATTARPAPPAGAPRERLEPRFPAGLTDELRARWVTIQTGFVDDPAQAVRQADERVAFRRYRSFFERQLTQ